MAAEVGDRELAAIALKLAEPLGQNSDVDGAGREGGAAPIGPALTAWTPVLPLRRRMQVADLPTL